MSDPLHHDLKSPFARRAPQHPLRFILILVAALTCRLAAEVATPPAAQPPDLAPTFGPPRGTLVIVVGGDLRDTGITEAFIARAGGAAAKIVIVPTAGGNRRPNGQLITYTADEVLAPWRRQLGLTQVTMLHTHDPAVANTAEFVQLLREASGVWFNGGRQWNLVDSYADTLTEREFHALLARGGVIGGSSAGAPIQGEFLVRGAVAGSKIMIAPEPRHQRGFAFLRGSAIDQHVDTRNRWDDLTPVIQRFPGLLGIGLSESTAIVVTGDRVEVMGKGQVAIHDHSRPISPAEKRYFIIAAGDTFDLKTRAVIKPATNRSPPPKNTAPVPLAEK